MNLRSMGPPLACLAALSGCVVAPLGPRYKRPAYRTAGPPPAPPSPAAPAAQSLVYFYPQRGQTEALRDRDRYALGAAVSSPRNAGGNAVIGAIVGAAMGAAAGEARNRAIDDAQARQEAAAARRPRVSWQTDDLRRAMSACMQGRGYTVQ